MPVAKRYVPRAEGQKILKELDCEPIPNMQDGAADWWRDPYGNNFAMQVHGPNRDYYRVQLDNVPIGLARVREITSRPRSRG